MSQRHDALGLSSFVAGLGALARSGEIRLSLAPLRAERVEPHVMHLQVEDLRSGLSRSMAYEVFDRADRFDLPTLAGVDVYFKQTLDTDLLEELPGRLGARVLPGGLTFGTRLPGTRLLGAQSVFTAFLAHAMSMGAEGLAGAAKRRLHDAYDIAGAIRVSEWERSPEDPLTGDVVFQTRLWPPVQGVVEDRQAVNRGRVEVVRALRAAFGGEDRVGLIRTEFAATEAPDALLARKVSRREYASQLKTSLISVNTHGLDGSPGFKVAESLAAGAAIVSQPFRFELPEPLLPDVHYLAFDEPEECVVQCRRLLQNPELAGRMRHANLSYYRRHVRPENHVRNLLARACA
ncbi:MAG: glycosyltransferase [marine benthic group bacterium]|nr:glycosyltransferase [Gemmatimonadota bacterium]MCL7989809.1 glycosyltransferase [Gemmatimonadota bacterium]